MWNRFIVCAALAFLMLGCTSYGGMTEDGRPVWEGTAVEGVAAPWGPVYFGDEPPPESTIAHEWCHIRRWQERWGPFGWAHYYVMYGLSMMGDREWACNEELACGVKSHPVCEK